MKLIIASLFLSSCLTLNEGAPPLEVKCVCAEALFDCADFEEYGRVPPYENY